jgi:hypothetical protein
MTKRQVSSSSTTVTAPKFDGKTKQLDDYKSLPLVQISTGARFIKPTPERIAKMAESLARDGQQHPILVRREDMSIGSTTRPKYQIISGATRLAAALQLSWTYIQAKIVRGLSKTDLEIAELAENEYRADFSADERARIRARLKELRAEQEEMLARRLRELEDQPKAKGGRGKKGGLADAARKAGVPRSTARRRDKPGQSSNGQVSADKPNGAVSPTPAATPAAEQVQALAAMGAKIATDAAAIAARRESTDLTVLREPITAEPITAEPITAEAFL